ncbi:high mobility group B protein 9-like [Telopea speciosissima]|uniref:high mobility group B protein 9-like n=1 Tax=Telopea speciosissima TaxID=54955 RepID=UPI001CC80360|nr:high mobility group B protein 9-like [Telopea speciosissima]
MSSNEDKITELLPPLMGLVEKRYPSPLASHEDVVKNPTVFWETLRRFHSVLGTKFMVPIIGGKELDLYLLYVEVTGRGGFQKVVREKKWRDVGGVFKFSPTTTSASFVLRKHYMSLLYYYEQVYFFKLQGPLLTPTAVSPTLKSPSCRSVMSDRMESASESIQQTPNQQLQQQLQLHMPHKRSTSSPYLDTVDPPYYPVMGTINGKFDCGYLVTVKLGSDVLHGVLYYPPALGSSCSIQTDNAIVPYNPALRHQGRRRRRRGRRGVDPSHPKPNRSGYNFFFAEKHSNLKTLYPTREREFTKMIGESWSKLSPEERMVYQNIGLKDKERYKRELKEYKERLKLLEPMEVRRTEPPPKKLK